MNTENNKIIAEFLHGKNTVHPNQYHENWNELMQVVERIESLGYTFTIAGVMCKVTKVLDIENTIVSFVLGDKSQKLNLTYITVVAFIKWYNKNNW